MILNNKRMGQEMYRGFRVSKGGNLFQIPSAKGEVGTFGRWGGSPSGFNFKIRRGKGKTC